MKLNRYKCKIFYFVPKSELHKWGEKKQKCLWRNKRPIGFSQFITIDFVEWPSRKASLLLIQHINRNVLPGLERQQLYAVVCQLACSQSIILRVPSPPSTQMTSRCLWGQGGQRGRKELSVLASLAEVGSYLLIPMLSLVSYVSSVEGVQKNRNAFLIKNSY